MQLHKLEGKYDFICPRGGDCVNIVYKTCSIQINVVWGQTFITLPLIFNKDLIFSGGHRKRIAIFVCNYNPEKPKIRENINKCPVYVELRAKCRQERKHFNELVTLLLRI